MFNENLASADLQPTLSVEAGKRLITENESSRKLYVIISGKARVFKSYIGQKITLAILGEGEIFGEMSFIDARPRSASVEAVTDMKLMVIDGDKGDDQIKNLPSWVWTIFRTVFHRFREMDRKIVGLESSFNYRKQGLKENVLAITIYRELRRFLRAIELVKKDLTSKGPDIVEEGIFKDLDDVLGNRAIGLRTFWRNLKDYDLIAVSKRDKVEYITIFSDRLKDFDSYLETEIRKERYLLLSHTAISVLRRLIGLVPNDARGEFLDLDVAQVKVNLVSGYDEGVKELLKAKIIDIAGSNFRVKPKEIHALYTYQIILKSFDYSVINTD